MYSLPCFASGNILQNYTLRCWHQCSQLGWPSLPLSLCVSEFVVSCFMATSSSHPIYILLPCDFAVPILWGEVSFSRTLNLDQTHFAVINRMWQKLGCMSVSLGYQRPCIFYYLSWCIFLRIPSLHPTLRIYSRLLGWGAGRGQSWAYQPGSMHQ